MSAADAPGSVYRAYDAADALLYVEYTALSPPQTGSPVARRGTLPPLVPLPGGPTVKHGTATCPECGRNVMVTQAGRLFRHRREISAPGAGSRCDGSGRVPVGSDDRAGAA